MTIKTIIQMLTIPATICFLLVACDSNSGSADIVGIPLPPEVSPSNFSADIAEPNRFFPLVEGYGWTYEGVTPDGAERVIVEVTDRKKLIQGVEATVVRAREWINGELKEDTDDWYAQDSEGNVWYFGEDVKNYRDGEVDNRAGSWEAGVDGALAGIIMWADPKVGSIYYQEYYRGEAEDVGEVLALNETIEVPTGSYSGCLKTEDTTQLEPGQVEFKWYCPGVGQVAEENIVDDFRLEMTAFETP